MVTFKIYHSTKFRNEAEIIKKSLIQEYPAEFNFTLEEIKEENALRIESNDKKYSNLRINHHDIFSIKSDIDSIFKNISVV